MSERFLIDAFDNGLVVIPLGEARRLAELNHALENSQTWGEFLAAVAVDPTTNGYLEEAYEDGLPLPDEPFAPDDIPGFGDGDWPTWPKQAMLDWLPESVALSSVAARQPEHVLCDVV